METDEKIAPNCPRCHRPMRLRTARKGKNAGNSFWGCEGWKPRGQGCDGLLPLDEVGSIPSESDPQSDKGPVAIPRLITLKPRWPGLQTRFLQCVGLPLPWVRALRDAPPPASLVRAFAQWRLDYPEPKQRLEGGLHNVLSVAESILTRGTLTLCSPRFEQTILEFAGVDWANDLCSALAAVARMPRLPSITCAYESEGERQFAEELLSSLGKEQLAEWLVPQIALASLCPGISKESGSRGDFYLAHPDGPELVVEIDGQQHAEHAAADAQRDAALVAAGCQVFRIPAHEVAADSGAALDVLRTALAEWPSNDSTALDSVGKALRLCQLGHQLQLALLEALRGGWLRWHTPEWRLRLVLPPDLDPSEPAVAVCATAAADFTELIGNLIDLYGTPTARPIPKIEWPEAEDREVPHLCICWHPRHDETRGLVPCFYISPAYVAREATAPLTSARPVTIAEPRRDCMRWFLSYLFRKEEFWEGQWETIERCLQGKDSVVLLPTGGGKSIAFQLAALLLPGRCIVVDPILALIDDQIDNLHGVGIDRCVGITSQITSIEERERLLQLLAGGHYLFCYVAPERFQIVAFREALRQFTTVLPISLIAIDEAHCVSEWGHDFRTAYLNIGRITREYCCHRDHVPPLVALTGTASRIVLKDVQRELGILDFDAIITPRTFDRPELTFEIERCSSDEKLARLKGILSRLPSDFGLDSASFFQSREERTAAGLVFCPHVNGPFGIEETGRALQHHLQIPVRYYSGTPPKTQAPRTWDETKRRTALRFKRNQDPLLVCTKAFGMGIDKPNIRYTIHTGLPASIEAFYQEAGRAGRDRSPAHCYIVLSIDNRSRVRRLLNPATPIEEILPATKEWGSGDDVTRALFFQCEAFRGPEADRLEIRALVGQMGPLHQRRRLSVSFDQNHRERQEKALHRLVVIGVVADYTLDHSRREFTVDLTGASQEEIIEAFTRYVATYQEGRAREKGQEAARSLGRDHNEFVLAVAGHLIEFIYQVIEHARRRMLFEMLRVCDTSGHGEGLREQILAYLEAHGDYEEVLQRVPGSQDGALGLVGEIADLLVTPHDAAALRGSVSRSLASYPDVPGLLLMRGLAEALAHNGDLEIAAENLRAGLHYAATEYHLSPATCGQALGTVLARITKADRDAALHLAAACLTPDTDSSLLRSLVATCPDEIAVVPAAELALRLTARCRTSCAAGVSVSETSNA